MFLPDVFGARRLCFVANRPFVIRPLSAAGWADLLSFLDDFVEGRSERKGPPRYDDPKSKEWLATAEGQVLEIWLALNDQGINYEQATKLWSSSTEHERQFVHHVLFSHRRTAPEAEPDGSDIAETWCGEGLAKVANMVGLEETGRYTLDQIEWLIKNGVVDENPADAPERLAKIVSNMQEQWGDKLAKLKPLGVANGSENGNG